MNKTDLIARVAEEIGGTKTESEAYVNSVLNQIGKALAAGESVVVPGFGTFEVRSRAARTMSDESSTLKGSATETWPTMPRSKNVRPPRSDLV